mgnify:FL=1|tara:strand:- start:59 stop:535 length:477 start_codon:yes stop_codon:yes gene_type:complete
MSFTKNKETDNYATDKKGWEIIEEYIPKDKKIWSPFYCDGKQKEYFKEMGMDIIHEDKDFFSYTPEYDIIVDNPPFSNMKEIGTRLKELDKPFILITPSITLLSKWFLLLFKDHLQAIFPLKRPTFTHYDTGKKGYSPPFGTLYLCYKMNLEKDLIFI